MIEYVAGNAYGWKSDLFPDELIPDILQLVIDSWRIFPKPDRLEHEVPISKRFTRIIRCEKNSRGDLPFKVYFEIPTTESNEDGEGRIDIYFSYIGTIREEVHFAFECKRLRVPYESKIKTNNSYYVGNQGMMCFVTGKYSGSLTNGGMIGYIMDGEIEKAIISVGQLIKNKRVDLKLDKDTGLEPSSIMIDSQNVRETRHTLSKKNFTIHHIFLAV